MAIIRPAIRLIPSWASSIRQTLGRWLLRDPQCGGTTDGNLEQLAKFVAELDWHMHRSEKRWEFYFTDPATDQQHGFPYRASEEVALHLINGLDVAGSEGRLVDAITAPLVLAKGDYMRPAGDWGLWYFCQASMEVSVDMFPDDDNGDLDLDEDVKGLEAKGEQEEDDAGGDAIAE